MRQGDLQTHFEGTGMPNILRRHAIAQIEPYEDIIYKL